MTDETLLDERDVEIVDGEPEGMIVDLDLADHLEGYWPSSKNVTQ